MMISILTLQRVVKNALIEECQHQTSNQIISLPLCLQNYQTHHEIPPGRKRSRQCQNTAEVKATSDTGRKSHMNWDVDSDADV
jgi:hypothetical protein